MKTQACRSHEEHDGLGSGGSGEPRILLVEPPAVSKFGNQRIMGGFGSNKTDFAWPPLDIMVISGCLEKNGIGSTLYDANSTRKTFDDVEAMVRAQKPAMVVFTTSSTTIHSDLKTAEVAKKVFRDTLTVAIGVHVMALPEEALGRCASLDVAVYSEPELVILDLVKSNYELGSVFGICYRDGDGEVRRNDPHPNCENLDELGFPSHDKLPWGIYHDPMTKRAPLTMVMGQRGCINNCIFCCQPAFWGRFRKRSVPHLIEELKWVEELGYKEVKWNDAGLTNDLEWAGELFEQMIENRIDLTWSCDARADRINAKIVKKMKQAGCHTIHLGLESADPGILKTIRKNVTPGQVKEAVSLIKKEGMQVLVYFMLGLPGETKQTMKKTIEFARTLDADLITLGIASPYPGTEFYDYLKGNNFLKTTDWSKYDPMGKPVFGYPDLSSEEIYRAMLHGMRSFYLRSSYLLKRLSSIRSLHELKINAQNGLAFVRRFALRK